MFKLGNRKALEEDFGLKYREKLLSYFYHKDEIAIYQVEKEKAIIVRIFQFNLTYTKNDVIITLA